jgi:ankyrin repeat protein
MNLPPPPPPQDDDPIITLFKPLAGQWELNDGNIKHIDIETGDTILHNYCEYIDSTPFEVYRYLIETKGCDVNVQDNDKYTPLMHALRYFKPDWSGYISVLMYLLTQNNVNVNTKDRFGGTVLHIACEKINTLPLEIFQVLIETKGCDVNAQDNIGDTPLHCALYNFDPNDGGDITILTYLLSQKSVNANIKGEYDNTLLHAACENTNIPPLDVFKLLIEILGCDVNVQDTSQNTPVRLALTYFKPHNRGDIAVLAYLINQQNLNVKIKDQNGFNLLHLACMINPSNTLNSVELDAECDTMLCQIVQIITERCLQEVFDEKTPLEATTTM